MFWFLGAFVLTILNILPSYAHAVPISTYFTNGAASYSKTESVTSVTSTPLKLLYRDTSRNSVSTSTQHGGKRPPAPYSPSSNNVESAGSLSLEVTVHLPEEVHNRTQSTKGQATPLELDEKYDTSGETPKGDSGPDLGFVTSESAEATEQHKYGGFVRNDRSESTGAGPDFANDGIRIARQTSVPCIYGQPLSGLAEVLADKTQALHDYCVSTLNFMMQLLSPTAHFIMQLTYHSNGGVHCTIWYYLVVFQSRFPQSKFPKVVCFNSKHILREPRFFIIIHL